MGKISFKKGTKAEYTAATKNADTLYFISDQKELYLGDTRVGEENVIEAININGTPATVTDRTVNIACETTSNKVTALSASSTDTQYPSAKVVYDSLQGKVSTEAGKGLSTNDYTTDEKTKLAGIAAGAEANVQSDWSVTDTTSDAYIANKPTVVTDATSTSTTDVLAASVGKDLQDEIDNLKALGRYLSLWNASTGLPATEPPTSPYTYKTGDYYVVGTVAAEGGTNYKPDGSTYTTGTASTVTETGDVAVSDAYIYDGTQWILQLNHGRQIAVDSELSSTSTNPLENRAVYSALQGKVSTETGKGLSTNDYTTDEKTKLTGIAAGAQVNVIESISLNGVAQTITNKGVNLVIDTPEGAELTANKVTTLSAESTDTQYPSAKVVYDTITSNEKTIAAALNSLNTIVANYEARIAALEAQLEVKSIS